MNNDQNNDQTLADNIRNAANKLCIALNAAGEAKLNISIEFKPYVLCSDGMTGNWRPLLTVRRTIILPTGPSV